MHPDTIPLGTTPRLTSKYTAPESGQLGAVGQPRAQDPGLTQCGRGRDCSSSKGTQMTRPRCTGVFRTAETLRLHAPPVPGHLSQPSSSRDTPGQTVTGGQEGPSLAVASSPAPGSPGALAWELRGCCGSAIRWFRPRDSTCCWFWRGIRTSPSTTQQIVNRCYTLGSRTELSVS